MLVSQSAINMKSHRIHVWHIYLYLVDFYVFFEWYMYINVGK